MKKFNFSFQILSAFLGAGGVLANEDNSSSVSAWHHQTATPTCVMVGRCEETGPVHCTITVAAQGMSTPIGTQLYQNFGGTCDSILLGRFQEN